MKKIMFNDRYGLTQAVLEGKKTMTRRIIKKEFEDIKAYHANGGWHFIVDTDEWDSVELKPQYEIGERVAIAQSYKQCWDIYQKQWESYNDLSSWRTPDATLGDSVQETAGWTNKMFVKAEYMPHRIRITGIKVERLQDITEQECICEGIKIKKGNRNGERPFGEFTFDGWDDYSFTAREAFAALIDKIRGNGTWNNNPLVFAYEFELTH